MLKVIDVSVYQPDIDYAKVKAAGIDGVILRCGLTYWGKQVCSADECFERHYKGFKAVGMPVGAYYYSAADTTEAARREADFVAGILKGKQLEFPVYYDVECEPRMGKLSKAELTEIAETFCNAIEKAGWFTGIYANTNYYLNKLNHAELAERYTIWLADYRGDKADKTLKRDIWQYSSKGSVDGISGNVDVSECYRDFPSIIKAAGLNGCGKEASTPATAPKPEAASYTVKKGDSWWSIAASQLGDGTRYTELAAYNNKKPTDTIYAGQVIKLPVKVASVAKTYTVKAGDSWWGIAASQLGDGTRYNELAKYNGKKPTDTIHPGDVIKLP